jgi:glutamate-1-semialdehyde aminotransferase
MIAGLVAMENYGADQIVRLNSLCYEMCTAMRGILKRLGEPAQILSQGSLFRLHLTASDICDYRSGKPTEAMTQRLGEIQRYLFHAGFLISKLCAGNISTVTTSSEIECFLIAFEGALVKTQRPGSGPERNLSLATS